MSYSDTLHDLLINCCNRDMGTILICEPNIRAIRKTCDVITNMLTDLRCGEFEVNFTQKTFTIHAINRIRVINPQITEMRGLDHATMYIDRYGIMPFEYMRRFKKYA